MGASSTNRNNSNTFTSTSDTMPLCMRTRARLAPLHLVAHARNRHHESSTAGSTITSVTASSSDDHDEDKDLDDEPKPKKAKSLSHYYPVFNTNCYLAEKLLSKAPLKKTKQSTSKKRPEAILCKAAPSFPSQLPELTISRKINGNMVELRTAISTRQTVKVAIGTDASVFDFYEEF
ncbi:unnamed protein product [Sphagnum balticum]